MKKGNRFLAMLMSIVSLMGILFAFPTTAHAADITVSVSNTGWNEGRAANLWGGGTIRGGRNIYVLYVKPDTILYCLEPGAPLDAGDGLNMNSYADTLRTPSIHEDGAVTRLLGRLFQYVDYSGTGSALSTDNGKALYVAARMLVWEVTQGERDADFNYVAPPGGYDPVRQFVDNSSMAQGYKDLIFSYYNYLVDKVQNHHRIPDFARMSQPNAPLYEMPDDGDVFRLALSDNNNVLGNYHFSANGISFTKNGNQLTATAQNAFTGEVMVTATHATAQRRGLICYGDGGGAMQDTASVGSPIEDPIRAYFRLKIATGRISVTKLDAETGKIPQGDATLAGAVFDIFDRHGNQVERIYGGANVTATSKEIPFGQYTVKEVTPPTGYTLSQIEWPVRISFATRNAEGLVLTDVSNRVIKGKIQLVKHSDDPDPAADPENPQVQKPLGGIVFEVYLKAAGSYDAAKETERDLLTTDENGYCLTKDLPYGVYVVREVQGADEHVPCTPFDVFINEDGRTYYYVVENPNYFGKVKVVKTDAETGKVIPLPNIEFKIKNVDTGEWVTQEILYPTPIVIDSYLTNAEGWLVMPKPLLHGNYELHEVQAPHGYVLTETPVPFTVTLENPVEYLEVAMPNMPVKGKVTVQKTGEVLTGAVESASDYGSLYTPEYTVRGIEGTVFDIIAAEDIVTPDGTVRATAGEVVDTITTDTDGFAASTELYLGNYHAVETAVPHGFVLDTGPLPFSLIYADQYTPLVTAETGLYNDRARAKVEVIKTAETVELDENGTAEAAPRITYVQASAEGIVFGLYAREAIKNVDGEEVIPAGALMDILTTGEGGTAVSTHDIPFGAYYVKELAARPCLVPSDIEYNVVVEYADSATPVFTVTANEGNAIENVLIKGKIKVIKTNEGKEPLAGVEFTITGANTGIVVKLVTGEDGTATTGVLPYDCYTIVETKTQAGYALDGSQHTLLLSHDGETYEFGIVNEKIRGKIKVIKTDGVTKTPLEGVVFEVFDTSGKVVATLATGKDGTAVTGWLPFGKYTVREKTARAGYVLDDAVRVIEITEHEKVYELALTNNRTPEPPKPPVPPAPSVPFKPSTNPKTGDDSNVVLWIGVFGCAALGLIGLSLYTRRRMKKNDGKSEENTENMEE